MVELMTSAAIPVLCVSEKNITLSIKKTQYLVILEAVIWGTNELLLIESMRVASRRVYVEQIKSMKLFKKYARINA